MSRGQELRCFCSRKPLLALYGLGSDGKLFVHVKVYKADRIFGEVVATGDVKIRCRECYRWYAVKVHQQGKPTLVETTDLPSEAS